MTTNDDWRAQLAEAERLQRQGQPDRARALCESVLARHPTRPQVLHLLGVLAHQRRDFRAAIDLIGRAISAGGHQPDYYVNRGVAMIAAGMPDAAIQHFRTALALKPDLAQAHLNLGVALTRKRMLEEAAQSLREAVRLAPNSADAHFNLGAVLQSLGNHRGASECYRAATRLQPTRFDAYYMLTRSANMAKEGAELVRELEASMQRGNLDDRNASFSHFSLGKIHNDLGDYAKAFHHYRAANDLDRRHATFDRTALTNYVDWAIGAFTPEFLAAHREDGSTSARPIFIVGMPRSGTTLVEQIVTAHSRVHGAGELEFWIRECAGQYRAKLDGWSRERVAETADRYLALLARVHASADFVTDKMPHNFLYLGFMHLAFPRARVIHCRRNPADTCLSIYFHKFAAGHGYANDLDDLAFFHRAYARLMEHWRRVLPAETLCEVRYEDLVADHEATARRLVEGAGLEWEARCLEFHRSERAVGTISDWQVRQPIYRESLARWRHYEPYIAPLLPLADEYEHEGR